MDTVYVAEENVAESAKSARNAVVEQARTLKKKASENVIKFVEDVAESEESEVETPVSKKKMKTPRRSGNDESGFSDFNPFQSGGEEAADRERRRRKVKPYPLFRS